MVVLDVLYRFAYGDGISSCNKSLGLIHLNFCIICQTYAMFQKFVVDPWQKSKAIPSDSCCVVFDMRHSVWMSLFFSEMEKNRCGFPLTDNGTQNAFGFLAMFTLRHINISLKGLFSEHKKKSSNCLPESLFIFLISVLICAFPELCVASLLCIRAAAFPV